MAVVKEYRCNECNRIFDSTVPSCIHCGSTKITRIFVTPFGFKSDKTKLQDDSLDHLTKSYNLSDFSNNESTRHDPQKPLESGWLSTNDATELAHLRTAVQDSSLNLGAAKVAPPTSQVKNGSIDPRVLGAHGAGKIVSDTQGQGAIDRAALEESVKGAA